jgi:hypothetical protein
MPFKALTLLPPAGRCKGPRVASAKKTGSDPMDSAP